MFRIIDGYRLDLQTPETMKLFSSIKKRMSKTKHGENVSNLELDKVFLAQCNLIDNKYQQKSEVLYIFRPNKFYAYLLNVEPNNIVFLKTFNTEFDKLIITFTDQNGRLFEIDDKVNLILFNNKWK